jgi:hypothetical protein
MSDLTPFLGFAGFFAGMMLWAQFTRWVGLLLVSGSKDGGDFLGPPKRRLIWVIPFLALVHPAPWLLGAAIFFAFRSIRGATGAGWIWFFGGVVLALLYMLFSTLTLLVRWRRSRTKR